MSRRCVSRPSGACWSASLPGSRSTDGAAPGSRRRRGGTPTARATELRAGLPARIPTSIRRARWPPEGRRRGVEALGRRGSPRSLSLSDQPQCRADFLTLRDDRSMITPDHVVPFVRSVAARPYAWRCAAAESNLAGSRPLQLRGHQPGSSTAACPRAVAGELVDSNGAGGEPAAPARRPEDRHRFQDFARTRRSQVIAAAMQGDGFSGTVSTTRAGLTGRRPSPRLRAGARM